MRTNIVSERKIFEHVRNFAYLSCNIGYKTGNYVNINLNMFQRGCETTKCKLPKKCPKQRQALAKKKKQTETAEILSTEFSQER